MKYHQHTDNIFSIDNFLSADQCKEYIDLSENIGYHAAKATVHKSERLAELLWEKSKAYIPERVGNSISTGFNVLFHFYRYQPAQESKRHKDESIVRTETEPIFFTFMVYLNDDFEGGETVFPQLTMKPRQGTALIFPHNLKHSEGAVSKGIKYVLCADVIYKLVEEEWIAQLPQVDAAP